MLKIFGAARGCPGRFRVRGGAVLGRAGKPSRNTLGKIGCGGGVVGKKTGVKNGILEGVFCDFSDAKYKD